MSQRKTTPTTHVIFDYGGTIADAPLFVFEVLKKIANKNGRELPSTYIDVIAEADSTKEFVKNFAITNNLDHIEAQLFEEYEINLLSQLRTNGLPMVSGAQKLIQHLHDNNIPMAIAANIKSADIERALTVTIGLNPEQFSHFVSGADDPDVKNNKPAPDVYLVCAERFSSPPKSADNCVIFEDSIRGITGALTTGMKTVLINERKTGLSDSMADRITIIVDSFHSFKPESVGLPPY